MDFLLIPMSYLSPFTTISILLLCVSQIKAGNVYQLDTSYSGSTFFNDFDFFTGADPTNGFVEYLDGASALAGGYALPDHSNGAAYMGVDDVTTLTFPGTGRKSVRITSQKSWTHGLFISDIAHMPGGICGTWPAHWMLGPNWPTNGEIDIIEGVNSVQQNLMSLHTSPGCTMVLQSTVGTPENTNCDTSVNYNAGCNIKSLSTITYGAQFNADGGGVFATQWTSDAITIWFFPRGNIPTDIINGNPDPSTWTDPQGVFEGGPSCDIDSHFAQNQIIFDTTFCGDYGDATWSSDNVCRNLATSCEKYVAGNPGAFTDAYWLVNSVKVYTLGPAPSSAPSAMKIPTSAAKIPTSTKIASSAMTISPVSVPPVESPLLSSSSALPRVSNRNVPIPSPSSLPPSINNPSSANLPTPSYTTSHRSTNTPIPLTPAIKYIGCLSNPYPFTNFLPTAYSDRMTYEICFARCQVQGYAGLYGGECFCAQNLDSRRNKPFPRTDCNIPCPGDRTEICGGLHNNGEIHKREDYAVLSKEKHRLLISVFEIPAGAIVEAEEARLEDELLSLQAFVPPSTFIELGCIGSSDNFPGFNFFPLKSYTSLKLCFRLCETQYQYIATGPTGCYCGDSAAVVGNDKNYRVPTSYCNNPCPTQNGEICGGEKNPRFPNSKPEFVIYTYQYAARVGDYHSLACMGSDANFPGFRYIPNFFASLQSCFEECKVGELPSHYVAAGPWGCYCADDDDFFHNPLNFDVKISRCNIECHATLSRDICVGGGVPRHSDPPFFELVYVLDSIQLQALGDHEDATSMGDDQDATPIGDDQDATPIGDDQDATPIGADQDATPIPDHRPIICLGTSLNFPNFAHFPHPNATLEFCIEVCRKFISLPIYYMSAWSTGCYCSARDNWYVYQGNFGLSLKYCDLPCPGTGENEVCGGKGLPYRSDPPFLLAYYVVDINRQALEDHEDTTLIGDDQDTALIGDDQDATPIRGHKAGLCMGSYHNFPGFLHIRHPNATLEFCFEKCKVVAFRSIYYVAAWSTGCYCSDDGSGVHEPGTFRLPFEYCDLPCPGSGNNEFCGGYSELDTNPPFFLVLYVVGDDVNRRDLDSRSDHNGDDMVFITPA